MSSRRPRIAMRGQRIGFLGRGVKMPSRQRSDAAHRLETLFGSTTVSTSVPDREAYRYDLQPRPSLLGAAFSATPDAVVWPDSAKAAAEMIGVCLEERSRFLPRGSGSRGLGGASPVRGGVVIDLSRMTRVLAVDGGKMVATVEAGASGVAVDEVLGKQGLCLMWHPSLASRSTLGGWVSTGGYGVGTHKYGNLGTQIQALEVVLPSGLLINASKESGGRYSIQNFVGTEGQMGVITSLGLPVSALAEKRLICVVLLDNESDGWRILDEASRLERPALLVKLVNRSRSRMLAEIGSLPTRGKPFIIAFDQGTSAETGRFADTLRGLLGGLRLETLDGDEAAKAWKTRFSFADAADDGPVAFAGEVILPTERLPQFADWLTLCMRPERTYLYECHLVGRGEALFLLGYFGDGHHGALRDVLATGLVVRAGLRAGGRPYGVGIWNSVHSRTAIGRDFKRLGLIKNETDRLGLLNPGKFFAVRTSAGLPVWRHALGLGLRLGASL